MATKSILCARLHNGVLLPAISFGTWRLRDGEAHTLPALKSALEVGYRAIDTAYRYGNEASVGQAVQEFEGKLSVETVEAENINNLVAVTEEEFHNNFSVPHGPVGESRRVFVGSKVWISHYTPAGIRETLEEHLQHTGRTVADMLVFHWSGEHVENNPDWAEEMVSPMLPEKRKVCWRVLEELYAAGKVRAIGVSNYDVKHLQGVVEDVEIRQRLGDPRATIPMYNQIEISPFCPASQEMMEYCAQKGIQLASYSTLGSRVGSANLLEHETIRRLSSKHRRAASQIVLRWALQQNIVALPRSTSRSHQIDNLDVYGFTLSDHDMNEMQKMKDYSKRVCPDPSLVA